MEVQIAGSKQSQLPSVVDGISSAAREGGIVSPILDNNPTQSPIPRSDSIDVRPDTRPRFSPKIGTNDTNTISWNTDCAKPVHQGVNNVRQVIPVIQSRHAIPKALFIVVGSPSMESADRRDSLLMGSPSSPRPQAILPIVPPIAFPEHAIKRVVAMLIDEADATWREESRRNRDELRSLGFAIDHHTDQEPYAQQTISVTTGASGPALVAFTSSRLRPDENPSMSGLQNTFDHEHPLTALSPSGQAEVPPIVDTAATTPPNSRDGIASPGACTGVFEAPQRITLGVDTTVSDDFGLWTSDRRVISHENDELEYIDVDPEDLRKASSQLVPGTEAKLNPQTNGDAIEDSASCISTITSRASSSESTNLINVEPPTIRIHEDSEITTRGLTPGAQLSIIQSVPTPPASNAISSGPIYTHESDTIRTSSTRTASPIPVETIAGDREQEQFVNSMHIASPQETMDYPMDGTSASRPLKRRLSSSVTINERENSNSYSSLASQASLPYPRPLKIKKLEDKDKGEEPQKVEPEKGEGLLAHLTPCSSVSCPRSLCLDGAAELSPSPLFEEKNQSKEQECRESSPHSLLEPVTNFPVPVATTLGSNDIHPEQRSSDSDASTLPNMQGDEVSTVEGSLYPSGGFDTTIRHNGEGLVTQGPFTPTSEDFLNFEADNRQAPGNHTSQARAKKDDYGTILLPYSPDDRHLTTEQEHPHFPRQSLTPGYDYSSVRQGPYDATHGSQTDELLHVVEIKESEFEAERPLAIGINCNDSSLRDGNFATAPLSAPPTGPSLFNPQKQLEFCDRVPPVQNFSTPLPQVEGSTQSLSLAPHNPKDMPPFVHALPPKPDFASPLDGIDSNELQILSLRSQAKDVPPSMGTFIIGTSTDSSSNVETGAWTTELDANSRVQNDPKSSEGNDINGLQDTSGPVPQKLVLNQRNGETSSGSQGSGNHEQTANPLPRMDIALGNGSDDASHGNSESIPALNLVDCISNAPVFEQPIAPSNQLRSHQTDSEDSSLGTNFNNTQTLPFQALPIYWRIRNSNGAQEANQFLLELVLKTPRVEREEEKET